ncbi:hypothetical protein RJ639_041896 [Escallonia herrerae]|uniref:Retrotransposon gag domain-containing protein n=1 Tax=Escallonia herrerae TaxID=1293975 RepID=A0AA88WIC1_9ASTE|nr:hypothetical protein RJ639_041896 [Escallonia herrerae]
MKNKRWRYIAAVNTSPSWVVAASSVVEEKPVRHWARLENATACWWEMIDRKWTTAQMVCTWELFKTKFDKNYIPRSVKLKRMVEFLNVEQGNLTVQQYLTKFTSLARHASYLVEGEDRRARKFQDGLKYEIKEKISILNINN